MKRSNALIFQKIQDDTLVFRPARRSDIVMKIRLKMAEKGLRNVDIAERLGVSEANVSRWLRGSQNLSVDTIYLLADAVEEPLSIELGRAADVMTHEMHYGAIGSDACNARYIEDEAGALCVGETIVSLKAYAQLRPKVDYDRNVFRDTKAKMGLEMVANE
jgi:transcriptional regulator with XRE-family HTH domain